MKKNIKSIVSGLLSCVFILSSFATSVKADDSKDLNVKNITFSYQATYFLSEDNSLWKTNELGELTKVRDDVENIFISNYQELLLVLEDGTLVLKNTYDMETEEIKLATGVVSCVKNKDAIYILRRDGSLFVSQYDSYSNDMSNLKFELISTDISNLYDGGYSLIYFTNKDNELYVYGNGIHSFYSMENNFTEPFFIMEDVVDVSANYNSALILDENDDVYYMGIYNFSGANFYSENDNIYEAKLLTGIDDVKEIEVGAESAIVVKNDNSLWVKGSNHSGNLGIESYETNDFIKISDNVQNVYAYDDRTIFIKEDNSLWGMGRNDYYQLGYIEPKDENHFDENGRRLIAENVKDIELSYSDTIIIDEDNSLWRMGGMELDTNEEPSFKKVDDDVKYVNSVFSNILYIKDDNNQLISTEPVVYKNNPYDEEESVEILIKVLKELGYEDVTNENYEEIMNYFDREEWKLYQEKFKEVVYNYEDYIIADNVEYVEGEFYIDTYGDLYKITNEDKHKFIRSNVSKVYQDYNQIYIIDENNILHYAYLYDMVTFSGNMTYNELEETYDVPEGYVSASGMTSEGEDGVYSEITYNFPKDNYDFVKSKIENVQDVSMEEHIGMYVLETDGTLYLVEEDYSDNGFYSGGMIIEVSSEEIIENGTEEVEESTTRSTSINILEKINNGIGYNTTVIDEEVKEFSKSWDNLIYVKENDELWGQGMNEYNQLGIHDIDEDYILEPIKIMDNVENAITNEGTTIILTKDGKVFGMGLNSDGKLGFEPQGHNYSIYNVTEATELNIDFEE